MTELLTAAQMRALEKAAIDSGAVTGLALMERAGQGVVEAVLAEWPDLKKGVHKAVVLCGPGNNGGDGFVIARLLAGRGWTVEVYLYGDPERLPPDARTNYDRWMTIGGVGPLDPRFEPSTRNAAVVVDALFGTGLGRPIEGLDLLLRDLCDAQGVGAGLPEAERPAFHPRVVAVDIPSGICSDSGRPLCPASFEGLPGKLAAPAAAADLTVSFHRLKAGHVLDEGPAYCGKVVVTDIGLGRTRRGSGRHAWLLDGSPGQPRVTPLGKRGGHKFNHGHALVLTGGFGKTGAARLAARAALRIGAGLVTLGAPGAARMECAAQLTAIMLRRVEDAAGLAEALEDRRLNALCLGPGLGLARACDLVEVAVRAERAPYVVLDADALSAFAAAPEDLFGMLHERCVLTPHGGEFERLFPDLAKRLREEAMSGPAYSKIDATRAAAARAGCVVLLKGPDTVIADPEGRCSVNAAVYDRSVPWLATAGAGDVLAGMICGLMARGAAPMAAAEMAAWLHVEAARSYGPGLIAEDLPEELPRVFRALGL
ncbi:NAD(P)H-hydrate dehydratase [Aestuariicoccus sp. MJ-SS9]|uniref:NAD(P)H-hydrate dehydratase n=1 Tax=Aestuariicoccus sp. MJ-SS9 TaxID=3079855 RepID=UPI0029070AE5|nr:NAD(P)H-hydrate dehydratase [Aestuariicoccus sp. MJ-SS9]MDU8913610.1 NAD(P)H-hydrate dehydratase [Aestuariicoccus sp. MJ-SS9]